MNSVSVALGDRLLFELADRFARDVLAMATCLHLQSVSDKGTLYLSHWNVAEWREMQVAIRCFSGYDRVRFLATLRQLIKIKRTEGNVAPTGTAWRAKVWEIARERGEPVVYVIPRLSSVERKEVGGV